jgi:glycosyltransferase involved in cell wall biosynthesis
MQVIKPYFTIVIPAWNRAEMLPETIESIQQQTYTNWECIVVDDGSTDDTAAVVKTIQEKDQRVRYLFQDNAERSAARNNGASNAQGMYLLFLDSDDKYAPEHLDGLFKLIQSLKEPVALLFTSLMYLTDKGLIKAEVPDMLPGQEFNYLLRQPITPSRVCIHHAIFTEFQFDTQIVIVEDLVLWVSIASKYPVYQLQAHTIHYRLHGGNSVDLSKNSYLSRKKGLKRLFYHADYRAIAARIPRETQQHLLAECSFNMARHHQYCGRYFRMAGCLFQSMLEKPLYRNRERLYMLLQPLIKAVRA